MRQTLDQKIKVGNNLRLIRERRKLSQAEVAFRAQITAECYYKVEKERVIPNILTALLIAEALNEPIHLLFHIAKKKVK